MYEQFLLEQEWKALSKEEQDEFNQKRLEHYNETGELLEFGELDF